MRGSKSAPDRFRSLILTQYYRPVPNFISGDIADLMRRHGDVTVITAHPCYPGNRFYPGTRWWRPERRLENGIVVWRLPMIPDQSRSLLRRAISYLSFLLPAMLLVPFVARRAQVVWVYQTPFTTALAALWLKVFARARLVYTYADLWPESITAAALASPGRLMRALFAYRRWINRRADMIICSTRGAKRLFESEGIPPRSVHYVPVWVDGAEELPCEEVRGEGSIVYAGNLGPAQQLETVVRAAAELERQGLSIRFDIYGSGSEEARLRALAQQLNLQRIRFHGRVSPQEAFSASTGALAQIVSLRPTPLFSMTIPSKLLFCFAAAAPILYGLEGEAAELAAASGGGIAFAAGDPGSLAAAVRELLRMGEDDIAGMRQSLRRYYHDNFARSTLLKRYDELLIVTSRGRAAPAVAAPPLLYRDPAER